MDAEVAAATDALGDCPGLLEAAENEFQWAQAHGAYAKDVYVDMILAPTDGAKYKASDRKTFRGLRASKVITAGSVAVHVPSWLIMSVRNPSLSWPGSPWQWLAKEVNNERELLALLLLAESLKDQSFFRPLLCALPRAYPELPLFWSDSKLRAAERATGSNKVCFKAQFADNSTAILPVADIIDGVHDNLTLTPMLRVGSDLTYIRKRLICLSFWDTLLEQFCLSDQSALIDASLWRHPLENQCRFSSTRPEYQLSKPLWEQNRSNMSRFKPFRIVIWFASQVPPKPQKIKSHSRVAQKCK